MRRLAICLLLGLVFASARLAAAHHSFAAVFDGEKDVKLTGEVVSVEWTNPHFHFSIDVKDAGGAVDALAVRRAIRRTCSCGKAGGVTRR